MKNSKLIVMFLTFLAMIAITPFIFGKLMNAKFNQMLNNLKSQGIVINELESKSTYLTTDRVFDVKVPGSVIDNNEIDYIHMKVEAVFKNLPVTDVRFKGKVKELVLKTLDNYQNQKFNEKIKDKIRFLVITPDFKNYKYTIEDDKIDFDKEFEVGYSGINGLFYNKDIKKNTLNIAKFYIKNDRFLAQANNLKSVRVIEGNVTSDDSKANFLIKIEDTNINVNNFSSHNVITYAKKVTSVTKADVDNINVNNQLLINKIELLNEVKGVDLDTLREIQTNPNPRDEDLIKLLEKGLKLESKLNIAEVKDKNEKLGFLNLDVKLDVKPTDNLIANINAKDFGFVDFKLKLKTTPKIANVIISAFPQALLIFADAKKEGDAIVVDFEFNNNKVLVNGQAR